QRRAGAVLVGKSGQRAAHREGGAERTRNGTGSNERRHGEIQRTAEENVELRAIHRFRQRMIEDRWCDGRAEVYRRTGDDDGPHALGERFADDGSLVSEELEAEWWIEAAGRRPQCQGAASDHDRVGERLRRKAE